MVKTKIPKEKDNEGKQEILSGNVHIQPDTGRNRLRNNRACISPVIKGDSRLHNLLGAVHRICNLRKYVRSKKIQAKNSLLSVRNNSKYNILPGSIAATVTFVKKSDSSFRCKSR